MKREYIATKLAFLSYGLLMGYLGMMVNSYPFPIIATVIGYIMITDWKSKFAKGGLDE